ncbi:Protein kintoun [Chionoecetes opilio]|uniref:Protein kintoun n=1 Tax=Chionoecetes opilio TaxID=41210 RepID=A0A8J4YR01_CHIOP|nr:Protein kintoun [Chionoecetes opilio]
MASQTTSCSGDGISREDYTLLAKSFKDKKFRQLLCDYVKEVNDPDNRKQFEEEVIEYEKERGVEAVFLHPSPGFALAVKGDGEPAFFVNICSSDVIQKPDLQPASSGGKPCHKWSLPHAAAKPRREVVAGREESQRHTTPVKQVVVHDVVYHPDALQLALHSPVMKQTLIDTAMDSLRKHFSVHINKVEQVDKQYIGIPAQCIIKRKVEKKHYEADEQHTANKDHRTNTIDDKVVGVSEDIINEKESEFIEPKYKLKHVRKMDMQDFSLQLIPQCSAPWQPQALELEVNLPGVSRASQVNADIQQQSVLLTTESNPNYKLELPLRYPIDEDRSAAKFDVSTQKLTLTLTVMPSSKSSDKLGSQGQSPPSDSGIECEFDFRTNGESDNVSVESVSSQDDGAKDVGVTGKEEEDSVFGASTVEHRLTIAPNYSMQQTKERLYIFLCCGNILPSSIKVDQVDDLAGIELSSIGGGQTLLHYSLKVDVSPYKIAASGLSHKEEDGKLVLMVKKAMAELWETCKIKHGNSLTTVDLSTCAVGDAAEKLKHTTPFPTTNIHPRFPTFIPLRWLSIPICPTHQPSLHISRGHIGASTGGKRTIIRDYVCYQEMSHVFDQTSNGSKIPKDAGKSDRVTRQSTGIQSKVGYQRIIHAQRAEDMRARETGLSVSLLENSPLDALGECRDHQPRRES